MAGDVSIRFRPARGFLGWRVVAAEALFAGAKLMLWCGAPVDFEKLKAAWLWLRPMEEVK